MNKNPYVLLALCSLATVVRGAPGDVDTTYNPSPPVRCYAPCLQPDGQIVLGGAYSTIGGVSRNYLARISAAGIIDPSFNPNVGAAQLTVYSVVLQPDGALVFGGTFSSVGGISRSRIARVNSAGVLDSGFNPAATGGNVYHVALQPDGKLLLSGDFTSVAGSTRNRIARLSAGGTLEAGFNPNANDRVRTITLMPDGSMFIGGEFTSVSGIAQSRLAKLSAAGTPVTSFAPAADAAVYTLARQPDGKVLVGGAFSLLGSFSRSRIARLNADGTVDATFNPSANDLVRSFAIQADGKIIIGGTFTVVAGQTRNRIARLLPDGTLDPTFNPNANSICWGVAQQADGKVLAAGDFTSIGGVSRNSYTRLLNDTATSSVTVPSPARIQWLRSGAAPEATHLTAELSVNNGVTWSLLGPATRITGGWEFNNLTLPESGRLRLRARTSGGYGNGTAGMIEEQTVFAFSPIQIWRQNNFATITPTGPAADNADPDKDGLENLVEFAFGLNPNLPDAAALPQWQRSAGGYDLTFTRPPGVSGVSYVAEYNTSLAPGDWLPVANTATPPAFHFTVPATGPRLYLRTRVTLP